MRMGSEDQEGGGGERGGGTRKGAMRREKVREKTRDAEPGEGGPVGWGKRNEDVVKAVAVNL
jgi:hypothetical protein